MLPPKHYNLFVLFSKLLADVYGQPSLLSCFHKKWAFNRFFLAKSLSNIRIIDMLDLFKLSFLQGMKTKYFRT
jgi:hypothetical protein